MNDKLVVKVDLEDDLKDKFNIIKTHYGMTSNAQALRLCINDAYRIVQEREKVFKALGKE